MKITDEKLRVLRAQVDDNMADAEVGPLLDHIEEREREIERLKEGLVGAATMDTALAGTRNRVLSRAESAEKKLEAVREWARTHTNTYVGSVDRCALEAILDGKEE